MSDTLQEQEDYGPSNPGWCSECQGYTHMPWCDDYMEPVKEVTKHDPWKAVHRIKVNHEKVIEAAITAINCYQWQGKEQAKYLAEAMNELDKAVAVLQRQPATTAHELAARGGGDEWYTDSQRSTDATIYSRAGNRWIGQVHARYAEQIVTEHNSHHFLREQNERLREALRSTAHNAVDKSGLCWCKVDDRVFGHGTRCTRLRRALNEHELRSGSSIKNYEGYS